MRRLIPHLFNIFSWLSFSIYTLIFFTLISFLAYKTGAPFSVQSIFGDADPIKAFLLKEHVFDGLYPAIFGTIILVVLTIIICVPVGIGTGIWLSEFGKGRIYSFMELFLDILSGLPSIIIGLFGFSMILFFHNLFPNKSPGFSILISAFCLSFIVLPYLAKSTESSLKSLDKSLKIAGPALGATRMENIRFVLIPNAFPSIFSGILLALARCAENTAVIMLTGAVASAGIPNSIMGRFEALPFFIYYTSSEYSSTQELEQAFNACIILIVICSFLFILSFIINKIALKGVKKS